MIEQIDIYDLFKSALLGTFFFFVIPIEIYFTSAKGIQCKVYRFSFCWMGSTNLKVKGGKVRFPSLLKSILFEAQFWVMTLYLCKLLVVGCNRFLGATIFLSCNGVLKNHIVESARLYGLYCSIFPVCEGWGHWNFNVEESIKVESFKLKLDFSIYKLCVFSLFFITHYPYRSLFKLAKTLLKKSKTAFWQRKTVAL